MSESVKPDLRRLRVADTEARVITAATELFVAQGYAGTTLAQVADAAGVGARTVYVRFGTKAALLIRAVGVAVVGDTAPVGVHDREWFQRSLRAPTLEERIALSARGTRDLFSRAGPLLAVAGQAEATEPSVAEAAQAGRVETLAGLRLFWEIAHRDGLITADADVEWLTVTATLLSSADTYVQRIKLLGSDLDGYETWLRSSMTRLASAAGKAPHAA